MSLFARLARDSFWLSIARVGAQVCMVFVTYLLARRLGLEVFGEYSFIAAAILMTLQLCSPRNTGIENRLGLELEPHRGGEAVGFLVFGEAA